MRICLVLEGSYPYVYGGVSTWMHSCIRSMPEHEFVLWVIGANAKDRGRFVYALPPNVVEVHEVFLDDALRLRGEAKPQPFTEEEQAALEELVRLGSPDWDKTKTRVRGAVKEIAHELVELYAIRQNKEGYVYGPDTVWQKEFEEMFPFEETEDQELAIEATKMDMESTKIMDRLICGDVGYGKTEVAIRAAFKAVQEGKQVVYLVPTTILAQQHYNTFAQRMKDFPVRVDLRCRFRSPKEQKKTIEDLK